MSFSNAKELVDEYWRKNKAGRKSTDKKPVDKGRKSVAAGDTSDVAEVRPKKRGRKSQVQLARSDSEMDVDQPQRQPKKPRKSQPQTETPEEVIVGNMSPFTHLDDWEPLIASVDTVERESDNSLMVYFTL
jgi:chromobox protein 5